MTAPERSPFYDANQANKERRVCAVCGREFYLTPTHTVCYPCQGWPHQGRTDVLVDVSGNAITGP